MALSSGDATRPGLCQSPGGVPARGVGVLKMSADLTQGLRDTRPDESPEPGEQPVGPSKRDFDTALPHGPQPATRAPVARARLVRGCQ
jgi:hypothetical protein